MKPVYIHNIGFVANLGGNSQEAWENCVSKKSCFSKFNGEAVAQINDADFDKFNPEHKGYKRLDRSTQLALFAADQLKQNLNKETSTLVAIGSSRGATGIWEEAYSSFSATGNAGLLDSPLTTAGQLASNVGAYLQSSNFIDIDQSITCASGLRAIADACAWLNAGFVDQAIAGGAEAPITNFTIAQMQALKILGGEGDFPCKALMPNLDKNTMVLGEGSVLFDLSLEPKNAVAKIVGVGFGTETGNSATGLSPDGKCFQHSMKMALKATGWEKPDAIVAHAPGTVKGDASEMAAIEQLFGNIPTTSTKFLSGHCFGSSGPVSLWMAVQIIKNKQWIAPDWSQSPEPKSVNRILINAVGFGANAVSLAVEYNPVL
ncbi:beta-ketoacyl synthase N-terminal-like domain-containing protein [Owenweeksia hongkongensis]|uniref:beta-ketoacyl synthase N-terminal-like domain-containing protein n=1 Tax=Owenweeksia hongkongensis TaxID=253245 RepID=UPI003A93EF69